MNIVLKVLSVLLCVVMILSVTIISTNALTSADLSISDDGIAFICKYEGFSATCYNDNTQQSIGYGSKCGDGSLHAEGTHSITKAEALQLLKNKIDTEYSPHVRWATRGLTMNQNQFDALCSQCYNTWQVEKSPLVSYLKGEIDEATARSQTAEFRINKGTADENGLRKRRIAEAELFFKDYTPFPVDLGDDFYACIYNPESQCQLTNSNNNVNLKSATNDANQLWYFERDSDLGYKITSFVDGTCLDAENGEYSNGTNVQTYDSNSSNSQRWYFIDIGMDHYSIHTKLGNAYIDAHTSGGIIEPGANTQLYSRQDTDAQVYCVNKVNDINAFLAHDIGTGFYANIINPTTGFLLTNTENNVTLNSKVSSGLTTAQIWKFERQPDNSYIIRSFMNNQCLDAENGKAEDGTNLQIYEDNATLAQKWIFVEPGNSNYMIKSVAGNAVIDAKTSAGEISDGANIQLYHPNGTTAQAYSIQPINNINKYFADDVGTDFNAYIINQSTGYRLTNNSNNITLDSETDNNNQVWRFERQEDNSYIIRSVVDSTCIDAEMGETEDGTNVQTYEYNGTDAQRWYFYKKGNNQYTIVSSKADVVIDAKTSAGEISDGTNIQLYHPNGTDAQIYTIQMIDDEQKILGDSDGDGVVTIMDVTIIQRYLVSIPVKSFDEKAADCDGDEDVSIIDATWIQRYLAEMRIPHKIGQIV